ncbi:MAG: Por secretion system C-terminal sorting protein [Hymenobacter sp.]|nr:Por secretion system C-terminal sorting protein [Hymenobacter sp.]
MKKTIQAVFGPASWLALGFGALVATAGLAATGTHLLAESTAAVPAVASAVHHGGANAPEDETVFSVTAANPDTDKDGIPDATEGTVDFDGDGRNASNDLDSDNDGIPDAVEANNGVLPANMAADGRFPAAFLAIPANDTDSDGLPNQVDPDGGTPLPDLDQDGDGKKNRVDRDADGDGLTDAREASGNTLRAGVNDNGFYTTFTDGDADGIHNNVDPNSGGTALPLTNTDATGRPDFLDLDSDDDGATDWYEAQDLAISVPSVRTLSNTDSDNDGIKNENDTDSGTALVPVNTDGADVADYVDTDTDNDGVADRIEFLDADHNGVADFTYAATDTDADGLVDAFDSFAGTGTDSGFNNLTGNVNGGNPTGSAVDSGMLSHRPNADNDYLFDWRDTDDDNDGILTAAEDAAGNYLVYSQGGVTVPDYLHLKAAEIDCKRGAELDWNDGTFYNGTYNNNAAKYLVGKNITRAGVKTTVTFVETLPTGNPSSGGFAYNTNPVLATDDFLLVSEIGVGFFQTGANTTSQLTTAKFAFSQPLRHLAFGFIDIDFNNGQFKDDIEIVGRRGGVVVPLAASDLVINSPVRHQLVAAATTGGQRVVGLSDAATKLAIAASNVTVSFTAPVDEVTIVYRNADGGAGVQRVGITNFTWCNTDFDGDNIADGTQSTLADDLDSDNDGIPDLKETGNVNIFADADGDGLPNYMDSNSPGAGVTFTDVNGDGINDLYDADLDGQVNPLDRDSDNDGITDTREAGGTDANGDGIIDSFADANSDGLNDATATTPLAVADFDGDGKANYLDRDSDNDGITDARETGIADVNGDGVADAYTATTPDINFDGIADAAVTASLPADFDGDGKANYVDRDSDNDGITDAREAGLADATNNGILDGATTDADGDGLYDSVDPTVAGGTAGTAPTLLNSDGTGLANYLDRDADDDGIVDAIEGGGVDANGDGVLDGIVDANADGLADTPLNPADTDGDGVANYSDRDSDNDGIWDLLEAQTTAGRRALAGTDVDGDGIDNNFDKDFNAAYAVTTPLNFDGTDTPDYLDQNSDNDKYNDFAEGFDDDHSGYSDNDIRARATAFALAGGNASFYVNALDTDNDKLPNYLDDANANGIADLLEFGSTYFHDTDGDGLIDLFDPSTFGAPCLMPNRTAGEADFRRTNTVTALPVELAVFEAKASGANALLSWTTASEKNNDFFAVERSLNGSEFAAIGQVRGQSSSTQPHDYTFTDAGIGAKATGAVYYRLRQMDLDGTASLSPVRALTFGAALAGRPTLYPNPTPDQATLDLTVWPAGAYPFTVTDMAGRVLLTGTLPGGAAQLLAVRQLPKGAYLLTVQSPSGPVSQRLLKD